MKSWRQHVRAAIGMGLAWGAAWAVAGGLLARVPGFDTDLPLPLLFGPLGLATGALFSALPVGIERGAAVDRRSPWRIAGRGAAGGLVLCAFIVMGAALRGGSMGQEFLVFGPALASASAATAVGSLALARRNERR